MKQLINKLTLAPTDLSNFLSCRHMSSLNLQAARGEVVRPSHTSVLLEELRERGISHENEYLQQLISEGLHVVGVDEFGDGEQSGSSRLEMTNAAMRDGADVIYQATLVDETWSGRVDFLRKVATKSDFGPWSYEVYDTKLARSTKAESILQICVYSDLLGKVQGMQPEYMHIVIPGNDFKPLNYRVDEYAAYFRLLKRSLKELISQPDETYPEKVGLCDYCAWWSQCEQRRRADDHLCYVAGISKSQIATLRTQGIERLADLAVTGPDLTPAQGSHGALIRVKEQAQAQLLARQSDGTYFKLKEPFGTEHGFALLPEPTPDDIFLDFEGDHFAEAGVQEYLLGYVTKSTDGNTVYSASWATNHEEERDIFESFIDFAIEVRRENPRAHIYHFAPYEPAALKRLMGRYDTRGAELDELLRAHAFVDLYKVVKRSLVAGVERYSIKDLEPYFGYERNQDVRVATMSRRIIENALTSGDSDRGLKKHYLIVEDYNREDCESAERLRDWLEQLRNGIITNGHSMPRPILQDGEAPESTSELDLRIESLKAMLLEGIPMNPDERSKDQQARYILAHMMEFYRREDKANWWEYYRLLELNESELVNERRAITGLCHAQTIEPKSAPLERYRFPHQELDARKGDQVHTLDETELGSVEDVNHSQRTIDMKKKMTTANKHPQAVILHSHVRTDAMRKSLMDFAEAVVEHGFELGDPYRAGVELLLRQPPPTCNPNAELQQPQETTAEAACRIALELDGNVLAIQGPPGTGKTYTGAMVVCELVRAGLKVGVTAVSHKVIVNLLEAVSEQAEESELEISIVHRKNGEYEGRHAIQYKYDYGTIHDQLDYGTINVLGATAWCWARPEFKQSVDVLIVDEAGQMSLANVLSCAPAGNSLVLLGDPQQLEQPLQGSHPEGSAVSALSYLGGGEKTMPADRGLFLSETYRLHPDIAEFTSEIYYEGKIVARPKLELQQILSRDANSTSFEGSGLLYMPVVHEGNHARSSEEVDVIRNLLESLLENYDWQNQDRVVRRLTKNDLLVVAPYNAQVSALNEAMPEFADQIGTVDRFQGQEAPVVIYSMTSSSPEDAPRGMEFLYNSFRFNVATSRARALCLLVGSKALFQPECRSPKQMKMANGFCRYMELVRTALPE